MTGLPYPTPTRLRIMRALGLRLIRHYLWVEPWSLDTVTDQNVSARVNTLAAAGLVVIPTATEDEHDTYSVPHPTDEGRAWYLRATGEVLPEPAGSGSTSPEPERLAALAAEIDRHTESVERAIAEGRGPKGILASLASPEPEPRPPLAVSPEVVHRLAVSGPARAVLRDPEGGTE